MEECIICFDETPYFVFFPCAHKVCLSCYKRLSRCPVCNCPGDLVPELQVDQVARPRLKSHRSTVCGIFVLIFIAYVSYEIFHTNL